MLFNANIAAAIFLLTSPALALWPEPKSIQIGSTTLKLSPDFQIDSVGIDSVPADLVDAVGRTLGFLANDTLQALVPDRGASFAEDEKFKNAKILRSLTLSLGTAGPLKSISEEAIAPLEERVEGYSLVIPDDGTAATLKANSSLGLFRGLTTFSQIWYELNGETYTREAPFAIEDAPAYPYRGLMLDTARNFLLIADLKRTLDAMSMVKINTLHWHIVDSQSFPLVVPGFTELSEKSAYTAQATYNASDVADLVAYAAARGIDVIPEIDTPGHTAAIADSHPEHIACAHASPWPKFANEAPAGQLRIANPETVKFTSDLLVAAASLFNSSYFNTGGDEINKSCYLEDKETQTQLTAHDVTFEAALDIFTDSIHGALRDNGKTAMVWEEIVDLVSVDNSTLVFVWIANDNGASVAKKGLRIIHASKDFFYLDCGAGEWLGDKPEGNSWCDPFKTWQKAYTFDPIANLTAEESKLVMGGQHLLWTEQSGPENLDSIVWPRAASSAEVFWTGSRGTGKEALPRLHDLSFRLRRRGVKAISLQPEFCALRPHACDWEE